MIKRGMPRPEVTDFDAAGMNIDPFMIRVNGKIVPSIIHNIRHTSHHQLAHIGTQTLKNNPDYNDFCGFGLRFEGGRRSNSLPNPGHGGHCERKERY